MKWQGGMCSLRALKDKRTEDKGQQGDGSGGARSVEFYPFFSCSCSCSIRSPHILTLPAKRTPQVPPDYLEPEQFRLILAKVALDTRRGIRDGALLLFLYNTGARVGEALRSRWSDLNLTRPWQVHLHCKPQGADLPLVEANCGFAAPTAGTEFGFTGRPGLSELARSAAHAGWRVPIQAANPIGEARKTRAKGVGMRRGPGQSPGSTF